MVRFARADGSKGSNKRMMDDATPWSEMVSSKRKMEDCVEDTEEVNGGMKKEVQVEKKAALSKVGEGTKKKKVPKKAALSKVGEGTKKKKVVPKKVALSNTLEENENETQQENAAPPKKKKNFLRTDVPDNIDIVVENGQKYQVFGNGKKKPWFELSYGESDRMTRFEGFWVKPDMVKQLKEMKKNLLETLDAGKGRKQMMKAKRKAHKELRRELICEQKDEFELKEAEAREEDKTADAHDEHKTADAHDEHKTTVNSDGIVEGVMVNGYTVTKEGAERLEQLRADLIKQSVPRDQQHLTMKGERRKEEKKYNKITWRVCLRCRKRGHELKECPEDAGAFGPEQTSVCYACGSTEHRLKDCPKGKGMDKFPHATCFICRRVGHISRQCPDNPRGLYPNGGSCRGCGSVDHLAANCVAMQMEQEKKTMKVGRIDGNDLESLDINEAECSLNSKPTTFRQEQKIIIFD